MIACPTPRNSQVTARKARELPFSHQNKIVLLTVLHTEVWLLCTHHLPLFGLSLCNPWEQISLTIHQLKGDMPSFNVKYGRKLSTNWLQRYNRLIRLSLICLVICPQICTAKKVLCLQVSRLPPARNAKLRDYKALNCAVSKSLHSGPRFCARITRPRYDQ